MRRGECWKHLAGSCLHQDAWSMAGQEQNTTTTAAEGGWRAEECICAAWGADEEALGT